MKKLLCLLLALLLLLTVVGCGNTAPTPDDTTIDAIEAGTVTFTADEAVFEKGTKVTAETVTAGKTYERAKTAVAAVAKKFTVFEFNAVKDEAKVQPNGTLAVTFRIPDDYSNNVKILYVADDGSTEEITATVNAGERTIVAELTHFSTYVLIDLGVDTATTTDSVTTTTEPATTTTSKPIMTSTSAKPTTTTTKASYSAFKSHDWMFRVVVEDNGMKFCHSYTITFSDNDPRIGEGLASPYEEMVPPEYRDQEKPDFEFGGIQWYTGAGGADPFTSVAEDGNTITLTMEGGQAIVLIRTGEATAKVVSNTLDLTIKAGDVFTIK